MTSRRTVMVMASIDATGRRDLLAGRRPPNTPGCYLFATANGTVIYVGKAKGLASRLASYLMGNPTGKTAAMLAEATELDWVVVPTETDALLLEATLIGKHQPRYNVRLRDSSSYPYLVVTGGPVPRLVYQRQPGDGDDRTFGPYPDARDAKATRDLLLELFPIRSCRTTTYRHHQRLGRPCLLADIGRCVAPCVARTSLEDHRALAGDLVAFLEGRRDDVLDTLDVRMRAAAAERNFELAATLRDRAGAARRIIDQQIVVDDVGELDADVVAVAHDEAARTAAVCRLEVRGGRVVGSATWPVDVHDETVPREALLTQMYPNRNAPALVLVDTPVDAVTLDEALSVARTVRLVCPQRGAKRRLVELAADNASEALRQGALRRAADPAARDMMLRELGDALGLPVPPLRVEATDISHLAGTGVVGSLVVASDGLLRKSDYRHFKLTVDRNDDVGAIYEVVYRRLERYLVGRDVPVGERDSFGRLPDLLVIDGGHSQLAAALAAADNVGVALPIVSLAKREELICLPDGREVQLGGSPARWFTQQLRDEAHRFALTYQRSTRRGVLASVLDDIDGVGPARRKALLDTFGTLEGIATASVDELAVVDGIGRQLASRILDRVGGTT